MTNEEIATIVESDDEVEDIEEDDNDDDDEQELQHDHDDNKDDNKEDGKEHKDEIHEKKGLLPSHHTDLGVPFLPWFLPKSNSPLISSTLPSTIRESIFTRLVRPRSDHYSARYDIDLGRSIDNFAQLRQITLKKRNIELSTQIAAGAERFQAKYQLHVPRVFPFCFITIDDRDRPITMLQSRTEETASEYMKQFLAILCHLRTVWDAILSKYDQGCKRAFQFPHQISAVKAFETQCKQTSHEITTVDLTFQSISIFQQTQTPGFRKWLKEMGLWNVFHLRTLSHQMGVIS